MSDSSSQTQAIIDEYLGLYVLCPVILCLHHGNDLPPVCFLQYATTLRAIIFYDYCITLDQEITFFWRRKFNGAAILFYANRYFTLLYIGYQIPVALFATEKVKARTRKIFAMFDRRFTLLSVVSCNTFSNVSTGVGTFPTLVWSTFSGLRTFALSGNRMLGVLVFLLSIVPFAVNLSVYAYGVDGVYLPKLGCSIVNHIDQTVAKSNPAQRFSAQDIGLTFAHLPLVTIASRTCLMGAEAVLIFLTWRTLQKKGKGLPHRDTLAGVLLRDGIIYFV
ncbi:hypothetical protein C8Q74DRAFT_1367096 [Fomes fomentarius]|nr:hypothetical protein C8Q74DRAFT_1367096 [Fomes fomentarius]